ncbi:DUF2851 family protein, partial [bacterium]|nr:DUF2851 family protein [bacterium]
IKGFFKNLHRQSRVEILARWLGSVNILDSIEAREVHNDLRREWTAFQQFWQRLENKQILEVGSQKSPSRPLNSPIRRLTGLFYHLEKLQFEGLLKSWLRFLQSCRREMDNSGRCLPAIMLLLDQMFPQPEWDPLNHLIVATSKQTNPSKLKLLGRQRQLIILVNSILPFFTAWSRLNQDRELEKTLFALFLLLPNEGQNKKTRFMEQRLLNTHPDIGIKKNLSYHQGLIQLHDDCCRSFYEGCNNCSMVKMMK